MNGLLKITETVIGAEQVNSVNARELHSQLEVKKAFSTWIQSALSNAGAIQGEDFIKLKNSLEGSGYKFDYILTTDMAKHIAMMSKVPKSKEIRDYFIRFEKEARKFIASQGQEILLMEKMLSTIKATDQRVTNTEEKLGKIESTMRIHNWQEKNLIDVKNKKVYALAKQHDFEQDQDMIRKVHSRIWKAFKNHYGIPRYNELPACKFQDGISFINRATLAQIL